MMDLNNKQQLFTLHFGGGNCYSYQFLKPFLPSSIDLHQLELPGRGKRTKEKLLLTESEAIEDLLVQITSIRNDHPYLIFGHSMGASLGIKITKRLEELGDPPKRLIVSGNAGPGSGKDNKLRSQMNDEALKDELRKLGGVSEEVLVNVELFDFFAPIIRADFRLLENSKKLNHNFKIMSPLTAVMGEQEETSDEIENWRNFTDGECKFYLLPGNHFFIHNHPSDLIKIIKNRYDRNLVS